MKKLILLLVAVLIVVLGFQQFADRAVAPSPQSETEKATSSDESTTSSESDSDAPQAGSGSSRSLPTAESIRSLADEYEKRVETSE